MIACATSPVTFEGTGSKFDKIFKKFSEVTGCAFPVLESIFLLFIYGDEPELIDTYPDFIVCDVSQTFIC
jgi:hypothetical protein